MLSQPKTAADVRLDAAMGAAVRHLDAAVKEQEQAVGRILGLVELLLESAPDRGTRARLEGILEACSFQDITGQRITKVNRFLRHLAKTLDLSISAPPQDSAQPEANAVPSGLTQEQVDRLLRGERI